VNEVFGGIEKCRISILRDFFRHGFDGSGSDDYSSSGSCIDGRLTSAWNWCVYMFVSVIISHMCIVG
jgi:hypothetical protein